MKILSLLAILFMASIEGNELYYYGGGEKIYLHPYKDRISVNWQKGVTTDDKEDILQSKPGIRSWYNIERYEVTIIEVDTTKAQTLLDQLSLLPQVEFTDFMLHATQNDSLILTNELVIKSDLAYPMDRIERQYQVESIRQDPFDDGYRVLKTHRNGQLNALEIANILTEEKKVTYACPNFISRIELHREPDDGYYSNQWALAKIGMPSAWDYGTGSSAIKVAIFDLGADLDHPDLKNAIVVGYDAVDIDYVPQCKPEDGHGTCCAGIAAAITHNNQGVAGIAGGWGVSGGCRIMPIRIGTRWVSDDDIKYCLEWATNEGAKVLSNSWGYLGYSYRTPVHEGIKYAFDHGSLVLFSSGNENTYLRYPSADEFAMAVGGTNYNDEKYSHGNYGYNLDIAAPTRDEGLSGIYTTDNRGSGGYGPGDYYSSFSGTSASCPHVAGLAGLLFSANSNLEHFDVERIIKIFARDLGAPGWDPLYGYGRIDAGNAIKHVILPYELTKAYASSPTLIASDVWRSFVNRARPEMAAGSYRCDVYKVEQTVTFATPYAEPPWGWFNFTGYSQANPNDCTEYLYRDVTNYTMTLRTYFYYIKYDAVGQPINKWAPANPYQYANEYSVLGRKPINAPTSLQATALPGNIKLTWVDNSGNELKFRIERSTNGTTFYLYDSVTQNITQFNDYNVVVERRYWYRVQAWAQEYYSDYSNVDDAMAAGVASPTALWLEPVALSNIRLHWTDNSQREDGFEIWRALEAGGFVLHKTIEQANVQEFTDQNLETGILYRYRVRAYKGTEYSDFSNEVSMSIGGVATSWDSLMTPFNNGSRVAIGSDGTIHLVYSVKMSEDAYQGYYRYSTDGGISFSAPYPLIDASIFPLSQEPLFPVITIDANNNPYIVWGYKRLKAAWMITYNHTFRQDGQWKISELSTFTASTSITHPLVCPLSIAIANDSVFMVINRYDEPFNKWRIRVVSKGLYWTGPEVRYYEFNRSFDDPCPPAIVADTLNRGGRLVVAFGSKQTGTGILYVYYRGLAPSSVWTEAFVYGDFQYPSLSSDRHYVYLAVKEYNSKSLYNVVLKWNKLSQRYDELTSEQVEPPLPSGEHGYPQNLANRVYIFQRDNQIYCRARHGDEWGPRIRISPPTTALHLFPQAALSQDQNWLHVLWTRYQEPFGSDALFKKVYTQSWPTPLTATNNSHKVLRDNDGSLHLSYLDYRSPGDTIPISIYYSKSTNNGQTWQEEWAGEGKYPGLAISEDGKKSGIAWLEEGREYLLYSYRDSLGYWAPPCTIIRYIWPPRIFPKAYSPPSIGFMSDTIHLVSRMRSNLWPSEIQYHILYWKFPFDRPGERTMEIVDRWVTTSIVPLPPGEPEPIPLCPSLALDFNRIPHIVWERPPGDSIIYPPIPPDDIYFASKATNQWTRSNISNSPDSSLNPSIDCYGGNVSVVWQEKVNGYAIYLRDLGYIGQADWIITDTVRFCELSAKNPTVRKNHVLWQEENGEKIQVLGRLWHGVENTWGSIEALSGPDYTSVFPHSEVWRDAGNAYFFSIWTKVSNTMTLECRLRQEPVAGVSIPYYYLQLGDSTPFTVYREGGMVVDSLKVDYGDSLVYFLPYVDSVAKCKLIVELYCPADKAGNGNSMIIDEIASLPSVSRNDKENEAVFRADEIKETSDISETEKGGWRVRLEVDGIMHRNLKLNPGLNRFDFWVPAAVSHDKEATITFGKISGGKVYCHRILWEQYERIEEANLAGNSGVQSSEAGEIPLRFYLNPALPNPFNRLTVIEYGLAHPSKVRIRVYDVTGRAVATLKNTYQAAGVYQLTWDSKGLANGVYFVELEARKYLSCRKVVRLK